MSEIAKSQVQELKEFLENVAPVLDHYRSKYVNDPVFKKDADELGIPDIIYRIQSAARIPTVNAMGKTKDFKIQQR